MKNKALRITIIIVLTMLAVSVYGYSAGIFMSGIQNGGGRAFDDMAVYAADDDYYADNDDEWEDDEPELVIYIGEEQVTEDNRSGDGWTFDDSTGILTLDNYEYCGSGTSPDDDMSLSRAAMRTCGEVTVKLIGDSEIVTSDGSKSNYGIYCKGHIRFIGSGTLTVRSGDADGSNSYSSGMEVISSYDWSLPRWQQTGAYNGTLNVAGDAELNVSSGDAGFRSTGINVAESISVSRNGSLTVETGKAYESVGIDSYSIRSSDNGYISAKAEGSEESKGACTDFISTDGDSHMIFKGLGQDDSVGLYLYMNYWSMNIRGDSIIECYADRRSYTKSPVRTRNELFDSEQYDEENRKQYPEGLVTGLLNSDFSDYIEDCNDPIDEGTCGDGLEWCLTRYGDLVISGDGAMYDYGKDGVSVRAPWEMSGDLIDTIAVLPGCTKVGDHAFAGYEMPDVLSVKIADSVEEIGEGAFDHALDHILQGGLELPAGLRKLEKSAFCRCRGIVGKVALPDSLAAIERSAFEGCETMTSVDMGDGVKTIGDYAFAACGRLNSVTLSESLEQIENDAFRECVALETMTMPRGLGYIGDSSFAECEELSEVVFNGNSPSVGKDTFAGCYGGFVIMYPQGASGWSTPKWNGYRAYPEHEHDQAGISIRAATTSSDGRFDHICSVCGTRSSRMIIPMIDEDSFSVEPGGVYTGSQIRPSVQVQDRTLTILQEGTDYDLVYTNNINAGTGTVTVRFKGKYAGTLTEDFTIRPKDLSNMTATLSATSYVYNGAEKKPTVTITGLTSGKDFDVAYSNNVNAGTATVKVTGKGNYTGSKTLTFKITPAQITSKTITLSATVYAYSGTVKKPTVKVDGVTTANYTVKYSNASSKNVGTYSVTVTGKANYTGSKTLSYKINPKATSIKSLTAGSKCFTAKWTKVSAQATGYQLQYSTSSTFASGNKTAKITSYATVSKKISSLTAKKKYYVRIRTYKTVSSTNYYSAWSAKKAVTTKS